ncbi:hypothetical protein Tco_0381206 [Tanacetum coccineum]
MDSSALISAGRWMGCGGACGLAGGGGMGGFDVGWTCSVMIDSVGLMGLGCMGVWVNSLVWDEGGMWKEWDMIGFNGVFNAASTKVTTAQRLRLLKEFLLSEKG